MPLVQCALERIAYRNDAGETWIGGELAWNTACRSAVIAASPHRLVVQRVREAVRERRVAGVDDGAAIGHGRIVGIGHGRQVRNTMSGRAQVCVRYTAGTGFAFGLAGIARSTLFAHCACVPPAATQAAVVP